MRRLVLVAAAAVLVLWSLFAWVAYSLLGLAGTLAVSNLDLLPVPPELVLWSVGLMGGLGGAAVWVVWGLGALAIAALTAAVLAFVPRRPAQPFPAAPPVTASPVARRPHAPAPSVPGGEAQRAEDAVARALGRQQRS